MSGVRNSNAVLINPNELTTKDGALAVAGKAVRKAHDVNTFKGTSQYRAVVLTDSIEISAEAHSNISGLNLAESEYNLLAAGDPKENHYQVRCRIIEPNSPHESIPAPSSLMSTPEDAQLIALHETFTTRNSVKNSRPPVAGDVVWVSYEKGPADGKLYNGHILNEPIIAQGSAGPTGGAAGGAFGPGGGGAFGNAGYNPQWTGPVMAPDAVAAMAEEVDTPGTPENKCYELAKEKTSKNIDQLHPMFLPYVKTFIARACAELNVLIVVTSGYRSFAEQQRLKAKNKNNASAGSSPHNFGLAIDLNPRQYDAATNSAGSTLAMKASGASTWNNTGVPKLWHSMGGFWKHKFSGGYQDPVHFDMKFGLKTSEWRSLASAQGKNGNEVDPRDHAGFNQPGGALASNVTPSGGGGDGAPPEAGE